VPRTQEEIDQALAEMDELFPIEMYEDAIRIISSHHKYDLLVYAEDIEGFRNDTLQILIEAEMLSDEQLKRIKKVDDFILSRKMPERLAELQNWLKKNGLGKTLGGRENMRKEIVEQALAELEEFRCIEMYESLINIVKENDLIWLEDYEYDIPDDRMDVLHTLIKADKLDLMQLYRIAEVDNFILSNHVPEKLSLLKAWLKRNALVVKDPNAIPAYPDNRPRPMLAHLEPSRGWYTKKEIEFFRRRNEVFLCLWENAKVADLQSFDKHDHRSLAHARSALQRVYWGNHLSEGQAYRILHADLKHSLDPEASQIHAKYMELITEMLECYDLQHHYYHHEDTFEALYEPCQRWIERLLNRWDWFTGNFEDEEERYSECRRAIIARRELDLYFACKQLPQKAIDEMIELDNAALLSPNWIYLDSSERLIISKFLMAQGIFDPLPIAEKADPKELQKIFET